MQVIGFVFCPLGCGAVIPRIDVARHQRLVCMHRTVECPHMGCNFRALASEISSHAASCAVENRRATMAKVARERREATTKCGCGVELTKFDMKVHKERDCPQRLVQCRITGCTEMVRLDLREFHETRQCEVMFNREEMLSYGKETIECDLGCGKYIELRNIANHKKNECEYREVTCNVVGCSMKIPAYERKSHESVWERKW